MAGSIFSQLASFFFLWAAIFNDILLIRFVLIMGNAFLLVNGSLGLPRWPEVINLPPPAIDTIVWSGLAFVLHAYAFVCLLVDEKAVRRFPEDNAESLYQLFRRRSGISRRDFLPILNQVKWIQIPAAGTVIPTDKDFHLIVEGVVVANIIGLRRRDEAKVHDQKVVARLHSGNCFEMRHANVFKIPVGFLNSSFQAIADTDNVVLCAWPIEALQGFARGPPVVVQAWRNFIAFCLADIAHRPMMPETEDHRDPDFDITPDVPDRRRNRAKEFFAWIAHSINPKPPKGLRHRPMPVIALHCDYPKPSTSSGIPPDSTLKEA
jgi:hypothetical protein